MKPLFFTLAFLSAALPAHGEVEVVATVPDLAAIAKEVGGGEVRVTAMALPTQDPHFVDAKPSLALRLSKAKLLVAVGLGLEQGWLPTLQLSARNRSIASGGDGYLECGRLVAVRDVPAAGVDRSSGDVHPAGNPHFLYDPRQALRCAAGIAARLAAVDPGNAKRYADNLAAFRTRLEAARVRWETRLAPLRGKPIVTYHRSWSYLLDWLGVVEIATLEAKPGIPPSPSHVAAVLKLGRSQGAKVVLQEAYYPDRIGRLVASKLGGRVVSVLGGADVAAGESYLEHVEHLVDDLAHAFGVP